MPDDVTSPKSPIDRRASPTDDLDEAKRRFQETYKNDPFPDIPPALLNAADIEDYVRQTGMICPFSRDRLKSASYAVRVGRKVIYWDPHDEEHEPVELDLADEEGFKIHRNSIVFINTEEFFQLPDYIAVRFNLHIEYVHRGLLLGTGPLVDPGFVGRLLIPLHNLTENIYILKQGEEIIWVEFTKVTPNSRWETTQARLKNEYELSGDYISFRDEKKDKEPWYYLDRARRKSKGAQFLYPTIRSSLPAALQETDKRARDAATSAEEAKRKAGDAAGEVERIGRRVFGFGAFGTIAIGVGVIATIIAGVAMWAEINSLVEQNFSVTGEIRRDVSLNKFEIRKAREGLETDIRDLRKQIDKLIKLNSDGSIPKPKQ